MSDFDDQKDIIRTIQILDRDAVDEIADTIGAVIERFRQATQTLTAQLDQAQQSKEDADRSAAELQQRLRIGVQLLKALEERADEIKDIGQSLEERKQAAMDAEQKLEEKFAEFDQRLGEAVTKFEQQTQNTSDGILERTVAVSELVEAAEVNVALMARRVSQAFEQTKTQPSPPATSISATQIESEPPEAYVFPTETNEQPAAESELFIAEPLQQPPSISTEEIDELVTSGDTLRNELDQLSALCEQLKNAQQAANINDEQFTIDDFVDEELQEEPSIKMQETQGSPQLQVPVSKLNTLIEQLKQTTLDEQQQRYVKAAEFAISGINDQVKTADNSLNVDAVEFELEYENFDFHGCIEKAIDLVTPTAEKAQLKLTHSIHEDVPANLRGDQGQLTRALVLAIEQAIHKATMDEVVLNVTTQYTTDEHFTLRFAIFEQSSEDQTTNETKPLSENDNSFSDTDFSSEEFGRIIEQMRGNFGVDDDDAEGFSLWFCISFGKSLEVVDDHRAHARLSLEGLKCNLGKVMDLSLGGIQVHCKRVPKGDLIDIELTSEEITINLTGEVVRNKKIGFRKYEVGLQFSDVDKETAKLITKISLSHWFHPTMGTE